MRGKVLSVNQCIPF